MTQGVMGNTLFNCLNAGHPACGRWFSVYYGRPKKRRVG